MGCAMKGQINRRGFIQGLGAGTAGLYLGGLNAFASNQAPTAPVAVARCAEYGPQAHAALAVMFDQLGGLERLVKGKSVAVKLNLTGTSKNRVNGLPLGMSHWVHPEIVGGTIHLLGKAGARRIVVVESSLDASHSLLQFMVDAGWNPSHFLSAAPNVGVVDTNYAGPNGRYERLRVPGGGLLFAAYDVNPAYINCDVYVSLAKLKEHSAAGVTLSMKNSFGIPPCTIYGKGAGIDRPGTVVKGSRFLLHDGSRQPAKPALTEIDPLSPRDAAIEFHV